LRLAHNKLRAVLDLAVFVGITAGENVASIVLPLDNLNEFAGKKIQDAHRLLLR